MKFCDLLNKKKRCEVIREAYFRYFLSSDAGTRMSDYFFLSGYLCAMYDNENITDSDYDVSMTEIEAVLRNG